MTNPFAQSAHYFEMTCELPKAAAENADIYFEDVAVSVSAFEIDEAKGVWKLTVLYAEKPDDADIKRRLALMNVKPKYVVEPRAQKDWVASIAQDFPPLHVGRFYVHGSHIKETPPIGTLALNIDAGAAFGSGEHATTSGCLRALESAHQKGKRPERVLDMGTGSGILAIAAAKLFPTACTEAYDLDKVSVRVAAENTRINRVHNHIKVAHSNGYLSKEIMRNAGGYDIILANILARPLCQMAKYASAALAPRGVLILSGLLNEQENMVLHAHRIQGLTLTERFRANGWSALVMEAA